MRTAAVYYSNAITFVQVAALNALSAHVYRSYI
jgi:hypothetical protein